MKIVFVTNGILFHQAYFCSRINHMPNVEFLCVISLPHDCEEQKVRLAVSANYDFQILDATENTTNWNDARKAIKNADLCLVGAENHDILKGIDRVYLRYSEHIFRNKFWFINPKTYLRFPKMLLTYQKESRTSWLLCASSHTKFDFNFYGLYRKKCLKFGYFPKANVGVDLSKKQFPLTTRDQVRILYVGRSIKLKHPAIAFYVLEKLRSRGCNCQLTFVSLPSKLRESLLKKYSYLVYEGFVTVIDELPPNKVMSLMASSHLFIFPSDKGEGFGATLYEAMSSKTAVIANKLAGGTDLLVENGVSGFVYKSKKDLDSILGKISQHPNVLKTVATKAKEFIDTRYNADVAAKNLIEFAKSGYKKEFQDREPLAKM